MSRWLSGGAEVSAAMFKRMIQTDVAAARRQGKLTHIQVSTHARHTTGPPPSGLHWQLSTARNGPQRTVKLSTGNLKNAHLKKESKLNQRNQNSRAREMLPARGGRARRDDSSSLPIA